MRMLAFVAPLLAPSAALTMPQRTRSSSCLTAATASPARPEKRRKGAAAPAAATTAATPPSVSPPPSRSPPSPVDAATAAAPAATPLPLPPPATAHTDAVLCAEKRMSASLATLSFAAPVTHVYDPLTYAWAPHKWYVRRYARRRVPALLVGMNPGPWGMAQTGVPFGEVASVRDFLHIPPDLPIHKPRVENPARPVSGLLCPRSEVSGRRLWREWAQAHFLSADAFAAACFVHNYCPLMFVEGGGRNRTPVQLRASERAAVEAECDAALRDIVAALQPATVVGIGVYAATRCRVALVELCERGLSVETLLHPSPASPAANAGWAGKAQVTMTAVLQRAAAVEGERDWREA